MSSLALAASGYSDEGVFLAGVGYGAIETHSVPARLPLHSAIYGTRETPITDGLLSSLSLWWLCLLRNEVTTAVCEERNQRHARCALCILKKWLCG